MSGALGLLGLGARARSIVMGVAAVRAALQRQELAMVVVASDHSRRTAEKVLRLAAATKVPAIMGPSAAVLGHRLGTGAIQAVGVKDAQLADGILAACDGQVMRRL